MNRYIEELKSYLSRLNDTDLEDSINYYQNYLEDGGFTNYDDCVNELGTARSLANKILADSSINTNQSRMDVHNNTNNGSALTIWLIVIAIIGSPVWLPLTLGGLLTIIAMVMAAFIMLIALAGIILAGIIAFIGSITWAVTHLASQFTISIILIGLSLIILGISLLLIPFTIKMFSGLMNGVKNMSIRLYNKIVKRNNAEKRRGR